MPRKKLCLSYPIMTLALLVAVLAISPTALRSFAQTIPSQPIKPNPFAACTIGGPGTNYGNAEVEPWVDVNPTDPNNIVAIWQQDRWSNGAAHGLITGVTHDGGITWQKRWAHLSQCAGGNAINGGNYQRASDPWLSFAPNGDLYQSSLSVTFSPVATAVLVSKSTDGGDTWGKPTTIISDTNSRFFNDKESISADPTDDHYVYAVWDRVTSSQDNATENESDAGTQAPAMFARTINAGQTWEKPRAIYDPGPDNSTLGNQLVIQPDGTLLNFFSESVVTPNRSRNARSTRYLALVRSSDKGVTWSKVIRATQENSRGVVEPDTRKPIRAEGFIPSVAVDRHNGNLYAVWQDRRFRNVDEIAFIRSIDGGETWSPPIRINQTPTSTTPLNQQTLLPAIHVADDGTIGVTYYDFRHNTPAPGVPTDYWLVTCRPSTMVACTSQTEWQQESRLTASSFDITQAPVTSSPAGFFIGDYQSLTSIGHNFMAVFIQVNNGQPADRTHVAFARVTP